MYGTLKFVIIGSGSKETQRRSRLGVGQEPAPAADESGQQRPVGSTDTVGNKKIMPSAGTHRSQQDGQGRRNRPRDHQLGGGSVGGRRAGRHPQRGGRADHPVGGGVRQVG